MFQTWLHLKRFFTTLLRPWHKRGKSTPLEHICKCFISHITTSYLQHVFNMLKDLQKCSATFLQMFYFTCNHSLMPWLWFDYDTTTIRLWRIVYCERLLPIWRKHVNFSS